MKALILSADGFEDLELFYPFYRLQEEGLSVDVATPRGEPIVGNHGYSAESDVAYDDVNHADYELLVLPGGSGPEKVRLREEAIDIARTFSAEGKILASIGHGAQVLISAGIVAGRSLTCSAAIRDDVRAAGGLYYDQAVVLDENLITSRGRGDLPLFLEKIAEALRSSGRVVE